jgi:phosphate transport system protein
MADTNPNRIGSGSYAGPVGLSQNIVDKTCRQVDDLLLRMAVLVRQGLAEAITALVDRDASLAEAVIRRDKEVDAIENTVDARTHQLFATLALVAQDLRRLWSATQAADEIERMGDHSKNLAKLALRLMKYEPCPLVDDVETIGEVVLEQLTHALSDFLDGDPRGIEVMRRRRRRIDKATTRLIKRSQETMRDDPDTIEAGICLISCAWELERLGRLGLNIGKQTVFRATGDQVRHGGRRLDMVEFEPGDGT